MMNRMVAGLSLIITILTFGSCERDHLYYETSRSALIHIKIDWEARTHIKPNGVSVYVYDSNGDKFSDVILSSDPNNVYLKLPPGTYSAIFHNNSMSELGGVHFTGSSCLDTFGIHANDATYEPVFKELDKKLFVDQADDVASYTLHNIVVDSDDIKYHYYKPDLADYEQVAAKTYNIEPDHIVHILRVIAYMDGSEYVTTKKPMGTIHGMSGGYYFGAEQTSEEDVMEQLEFKMVSGKTRITKGDTKATLGALKLLDPDDKDGFSDEELEGLGRASVDINTFGMHSVDPDNQKYRLHMRFYLYDGTSVDYDVDVTGYISTEDTGTNNLHKIEMILGSIPDGGGDPGDGSWGPDDDDHGPSGVFDPTLDDWVDVEVELPM